MTSEITLTRGLVALVDPNDVPLLHGYRWRALKGDNRWYAIAWIRQAGGSRRAIAMHRFLLASPAADVDHINGDGLDNRRHNLRLATDSQNGANRSAQSGGTSRYKGVYWRAAKRRWLAVVQVQGKKIPAGSYRNEEEAAVAYDAVARAHFGTYAALNFPGPGEQSAHRRDVPQGRAS